MHQVINDVLPLLSESTVYQYSYYSASSSFLKKIFTVFNSRMSKWVNEYVKEEQALKVKAQQSGYLNLFCSNYSIENPFKYDEPIGLYTQGEPQYSFDRYREQMDDKNKKLEEAFDNLSSIRAVINSSIETNATEGKSRAVRRSLSCVELSTISQGFNTTAYNSRPNSTY